MIVSDDFFQKCFNSIQQLIKTQTVVGDPVVTADKSLVLPVSKITFGVLGANGDYPVKSKNKDGVFGAAGGSAVGVSVKPVGFLVCGYNGHKLIKTEGEESQKNWFEIISEVIDKIKSK